MTLKKQYWKDGNIFKMSTGELRMVWGNKLIDQHGFISECFISDNLVNTDSTIDEKVIEIYEKNDSAEYFNQLNIPNSTPIWKRGSHIYSLEYIKDKLGIKNNEELIII